MENDEIIIPSYEFEKRDLALVQKQRLENFEKLKNLVGTAPWDQVMWNTIIEHIDSKDNNG